MGEDGVSKGTVDNRCWLRTGQAIMQAGSCIYMMGGLTTRDGTKSNDVSHHVLGVGDTLYMLV